jgi:Zn finger protein HypA/HybF involved in hydrogenase expression
MSLKTIEIPKRAGYSQKYSLQRRNSQGFFEKVETFQDPISPEEVQRTFGPGYYVLRATKPRFKTVWKNRLGASENRNEVQALKRRTTHITYAVAGVAAAEVVGFGLSHLRFSGIEERLDKVETVIHTFKPVSLRCVSCGNSLDYLLQKFCSQCGSPVNWPRKSLPISPMEFEAQCFKCKLPLRKHQGYCPNCGQSRPLPVYTLKQEMPMIARLSG